MQLVTIVALFVLFSFAAATKRDTSSAANKHKSNLNQASTNIKSKNGKAAKVKTSDGHGSTISNNQTAKAAPKENKWAKKCYRGMNSPHEFFASNSCKKRCHPMETYCHEEACLCVKVKGCKRGKVKCPDH